MSNPFTDRLPPQSLESEMCYLGALLIAGVDPAFQRQLRQAVRADQFLQADHAILFNVIADRLDAGGNVDGFIVREDLIRRDMLDDVGGLEYLAQILNSAPDYANGHDYAAIVREKANLRAIITIATDAIRAAYLPASKDVSVATARAVADKLATLCSDGTTDTVITLADAAESVMARKDEPQARRIKTLIGTLDNQIGGLARGKFHLVGADARVGKSALIKQILLNISRGEAGTEPVRCGLVTIEEDRQKVGENMLANVSGVPNHCIAHGNLSGAQWATLADAASTMDSVPFFIDDRQSRLEDVVGAIERMATKYKCDVVAVDHLHLISCRAENREREISIIAEALKLAFKRCNVAGLVACQLNRGSEAKEKPTMRSLRGSAALEFNGDTIMLLFREDVVRYQEPNYVPSKIMEVNVAKQKDGAMGEFRLSFDGKTQAITNYDPMSAGMKSWSSPEEYGI